MSRRYVTAARLAELKRSLSMRDRAVITTLARVRVATSTQLERLHFSDVTRRQARSVLASLTDRRLLARLPRRIGGLRAGSAGFVYALDVAGQHLCSPGQRRPQRPWNVGLPFLRHALCVTELYVRLLEAERAGLLQMADFVTEPRCWRRFPGHGGGRATLKPDAVTTLKLGGYEDRWFLEVDRGTESPATLGRQCDHYRRYWQSGIEQARTEVFPRVLWLVPDERRHDQLVDVLGRQSAETWALFAVATFDTAIKRLLRGAGS